MMYTEGGCFIVGSVLGCSMGPSPGKEHPTPSHTNIKGSSTIPIKQKQNNRATTTQDNEFF